MLFKWHPAGAFLATCGSNRIVNIFNRQGETVGTIALEGSGKCLQLDWDPNGETLAILQQGSSIIKLWDANQQRADELDTRREEEGNDTLKDLSFVKWAVNQPFLAVASAKGALLLYDRRTLKKAWFMGRHTKKIVSGAWNEDALLALCGEDKQISISNAEGDILLQHPLKDYQPFDVRFHRGGIPAAAGADCDVVSVALRDDRGKRPPSVFVLNTDPDAIGSKCEIPFSSQYGKIVGYEWCGPYHVCAGFEGGYLSVMVSGDAEEVFATRLFPSGGVRCVAVSALLGRAAVCAGNTVKLVALGSPDDPSTYSELRDEEIELPPDAGAIERIEWTGDGQILSVSSESGVVFSFLASLPILSAAHGSKYIYLTSLLELSVVDSADEAAPPLEVRLTMEPTFVALGSTHVALGMNNHVSFHLLSPDGCVHVATREYVGTVEAIKLNGDFVGVLTEGRVCLDSLDAAGDGGGIGAVSRVFPEGGHQAPRDVTCLAMTKEFLIYGTQRGVITVVYLPEMSVVAEFRHEGAIVDVFPNALGTRIAFVDASRSAFLLSPVDDSVLPLPRLPPNLKGILWDRVDPGVVMAYGASSYGVYLYLPHSVSGASVAPISPELVPYPTASLSPILLSGGVATCQEPSGAITPLVLPTHQALHSLEQRGGATPDKVRKCFGQALEVGRLQAAWELATRLKEKALFSALGEAALRQLDINLATRVYRQLGDAGMVMALRKLEGLEDAHLLSGHLALIFNDHAGAQAHFLQSTRPLAALEMRRDLLHWKQALDLAKTLAAEQVPTISREYAKQLEFKELYDQALTYYTAGLGGAPASTGMPWRGDAPHDRLCRAGVAKMKLRTSEVGEGVRLALEGEDRDCCKECAAVVEALGVRERLPDAARLYEAAELPEKAAAIYIKLKKWSAVSPLMARISSPKLHSEYAKAKEAEGSYQDAVAAYEKANDPDSVVRILLAHLGQAPRAMSIVRESRSPVGALAVAEYCTNKDDAAGAIEFLVLAKRHANGFDLAAAKDLMEVYTSALGGAGSLDENRKVAQYYEANGDHLRAGEFWFACKEYAKALRLFLQCGERAVDQAIEVVGRARSDMLTHQLIDFLMGETDGVPKDPNYIFRLYMALGNYPQAAKTAIIIARQEQELGNYRVAHGILFETHRELTAQRIRVPQELAQNLMLLHSYVLVRPLTKLGDHLSAARMLVRVAKHISKFPMHVVPILTSTVIECHKGNLRASAFEYATMLMRPEYRQQIGEAYKRKIEAIVRKPGDKTDVDEPETPSPFDPSAVVAETVLECPSTRNTLPYCIATGRHITTDDLMVCPSCSFPALYSRFAALVEAGETCPMCQQEVPAASLRKMDEEEAIEWVQGATKKENAGRRWGAAGLAAAAKSGGGLGSIVAAAKADESKHTTGLAAAAKALGRAAA